MNVIIESIRKVEKSGRREWAEWERGGRGGRGEKGGDKVEDKWIRHIKREKTDDFHLTSN